MAKKGLGPDEFYDGPAVLQQLSIHSSRNAPENSVKLPPKTERK